MMFWAIVLIVFLGVVLIGSIMGLTSAGTIAKLQKQNKNLNARLEILESALEKGHLKTAAKPDVSKISEAEFSLSPEPVVEAKTVFTPEPRPIVQSPQEAVSEPQPIPAKAAMQPVTAQVDMSATRETKVPKPEMPSRNLEELIGGQWSVWVGGLALLVGAVLLIRFSIEAGIFGPGARIMMALVMGVVLLLAGEWLKRSDDKVLKGKLGEAAKALQGNTSIPGLLSAVGIFTLLGASYAAHALYGFIPAFAAFVALALISLGAMALSLRQGPLLAGIGLLASLATPLLIQTDTPSLLMLIAYLVLIGGAALALSARKSWGWLATGTVFGWLGWIWISVKATTNGQIALWSAFLAFAFAVTVWFAQQHKAELVKDNPDTVKHDDLEFLNIQSVWAIAWGGLAAILITFVAGINGFNASNDGTSVFILGLGSVGALVGAAILFRKQSGHLVTAGLLGLALMLSSTVTIKTVIFMASITVIVVLSFLRSLDRMEDANVERQAVWSFFAVALGLTSVIVLELVNGAPRFDVFHMSAALGFAGFFAGIVYWFQRQGADWENVAIPVIGAGLAWVLAGFLGLEDLSFSLLLSLGAALAGLAIWRVPIAGQRLVLIGVAGLIFAHALFDQFPNSQTISTTPILNALWIYLALPAAILAGAAVVSRLKPAEHGVQKFLDGVIEAAALAGFALFAVFQIRHLSNGGEVYADSLGHAELGLQVSIGLCFTLAGLSKRFSGNFVLSKSAEVISYVTLAIFALGSLMIFSPFFRKDELITGNIAFNSLMTGLLVPTILMGLCAAMARGKRPENYINILGGLALAGALSWVTAIIRFMFNGPKINIWSADFSGLELWTISTVWIAFGVALLALGVWRKEQALRIASGIVIILTVLKAFLIDMAGLEGVLRAMSFVALGLILIVIGRAYQRFWLSSEVKEKEA